MRRQGGSSGGAPSLRSDDPVNDASARIEVLSALRGQRRPPVTVSGYPHRVTVRDDGLTLFLRSTYEGARFAGGRVPVEVLGDLTALRELLVDFARLIFLEERPDRSRFPRGYLESTALWLTGIEDGSAALLLERPATEVLPLDIESDPFEDARDRLLEAVEAAAQGHVAMRPMPSKLLKRFNQIGRGLRPGEHLEFVSPTGARRATYDHEVRRRLVEDVAPVLDDFIAIGPVVAVELDKGSIRVQTETGPVDAAYPEDADKDVRGLLQGQPASGRYVDGAIPVRAVGTGLFRRGLLVRFDADELEVVEFDRTGDFASLVKEVTAILRLPEGWLDGEGEPVAEDIAEHFLVVMVGIADAGFSKPFVYPTPTGGLRAEWTFPDSEAVCEVDRDRSVFVHVVEKGNALGRSIELSQATSAMDVAEHFSKLLATSTVDEPND